MAKRLREKPGPPQLGHNMHVLAGHERLDFLHREHRHGKVLDVGCGQGAFSIFLKERGNDVVAIDLFDVSEHLAKYEVEFHQTDVYDFETEDKFDTIILMEVVEHLEEPLKAIKKLYGLLAPNGVLLITTPHVSDWDYEEDHIWRWDYKQFLDMIREVDWEAEIWMDSTFLYATLLKETP